MSCIHAKITEVEDDDFQAMINELYHCVDWPRHDEDLPTIFNLLSAIAAQDIKALTSNHLPTAGILTTKIGKLPDGLVYEFCRELAGILQTHIEAFDGKTVLSLVKSYCSFLIKPIKKKPNQKLSRHDQMTRIILQRRANGDL